MGKLKKNILRLTALMCKIERKGLQNSKFNYKSYLANPRYFNEA